MAQVLPRLRLIALCGLALVAALLLWEHAGALVSPGGSAAGDRAALAPADLAGGSAAERAEAQGVGEALGEPAGGERRGVQSDPSLAPVLLRGLVLDALGQPLPGAEVFAQTGSWWTVAPIDVDAREVGRLHAGVQRLRTDGSGRFAFDRGLVPGATLNVSVLASGHAPMRILREVLDPASPMDLGTLRLEPGASLGGRVTDSAGRAVADCEILLSLERGIADFVGDFPGRGAPLCKTAEDGSFSVDRLAAGPWSLLFDAPGLCVKRVSGVLGPGQSQRDMRVVLEAGAELRGVLRGVPAEERAGLWVESRCEGQPGDAARARPRAAPLAAEGASADPDSVDSSAGDLAFVLGGLPVGESQLVRITRAAPGDPLGPRRPVPQVLALGVPGGEQAVELLWGEDLRLQARVVDPRGQPVEEFTAFAALGYFGGDRLLPGTDGDPSRHEDGRLDATGFDLYSADQERQLRVFAPGFAEARAPIPGLRPGAALDLGELRLESAPLVKVQVLDGTGRPQVGAQVYLSGVESPLDETMVLEGLVQGAWLRGASFGSTDAQGWARLTGRLEEALVLRAWAPGLALTRLELPASAERQRSLRLELLAGAELVVRYADAGGRARSARRIRITGREVEPAGVALWSRSARTDGQGIARFRDLPPGSWSVGPERHPRAWQAEDAAGLSAEARMVLRAGERREIALLAPDEWEVSGRVEEFSGPLAGATLLLAPDDWREGATGDRDAWGSRFNRLTNSQGRFRFEGIPGGTYSLVVQHDTRAIPTRLAIVVGPQLEPVLVRLDRTELEGRLVDQDGVGLAGQHVVVNAPRAERAFNNGVRLYENERGEVSWSWFQDQRNLSVTDRDGRFAFRGVRAEVPLTLDLLPQGDLEAFASPAKRTTEPFAVDARGQVSWTVPVGGALDIEVAGEPSAEDWRVVLVPADGERRGAGLDRRQLAAQPKLSFPALAPGAWLVRWERRLGEGFEAVRTYTVVLHARERSSLRIDP